MPVASLDCSSYASLPRTSRYASSDSKPPLSTDYSYRTPSGKYTSSTSSYNYKYNPVSSPSKFENILSSGLTTGRYSSTVTTGLSSTNRYLSKYDDLTPATSYTSRYASTSTRSVTSSPQLTRRGLERTHHTLSRSQGALSSHETSPVRSTPPLSRRTSRTDLYSRSYKTASDAEDEKKTCSGLRNLGNTCFMNSVVQCLFHTAPLREYCNESRYMSDLNYSTSVMKGSLARTFSELLKKMAEGGSTVSPLDFKHQVEKFAPRFSGYSQQDAQEFLRYLLNGLHEDVNRITTRIRTSLPDIDEDLTDSQKATEAWRRYAMLNDSRIVELFVGQLKSTLTCTSCGYKSVTFDPFWDLSLPIPRSVGRVSLSSCLNSFTEEELLDGDERPTCGQCKTRRACTKSLSLYKLPQILVLHLKRFSPNERYRSKLSNKVEFPVTGLDISKYSSGSVIPTYNLYAVSNHRGTTMSGHYTAYCKDKTTLAWHEYDDTRVNKVRTSDDVVTDDAYVLFYEMDFVR